MKKTLVLFSFLACLLMLSAIPAFAENNMNTNRINNTPGTELKNDINRGINDTNRALGTDVPRFDGTNRSNMNMNNYDNTYRTNTDGYMNNYRSNNYRTNNYRTNAYRTNATNDRGFDWGWLGLLGLLGLAGMRNRDRDRDRA